MCKLIGDWLADLLAAVYHKLTDVAKSYWDYPQGAMWKHADSREEYHWSVPVRRHLVSRWNLSSRWRGLVSRSMSTVSQVWDCGDILAALVHSLGTQQLWKCILHFRRHRRRWNFISRWSASIAVLSDHWTKLGNQIPIFVAALETARMRAWGS